MEFSVIVFDTAPTGHTLRLLSFPTLLEKGIGKLVQLKSRFGPLFSSVRLFLCFALSLSHTHLTHATQMTSMLGLPEGEDAITGKMESTRKIVEQVNTQFKDPDMTTFVCVCIPEVSPVSLCAI